MRKPRYTKRTVAPVSMKRLVNVYIAGQKFGDWTIVGKGKKKDYLICKCVCGTVREVLVYSLRSNKSVSCGCARLRKLANEENKAD